MTINIPGERVKSASETRVASVSFAQVLDSGVTLSGTPTVTGSPSGLTISSAQRNSSAVTINGASVAANTAVLFTAAGGSAGQTYTITVSVGTSASETLVRRVRLKVVE